MRLSVGFSDKKIDDNYYEILLPHIGFHYCNDYFDGRIYVYKDDSVNFDTIIDYFMSRRNFTAGVGKIRFSKKNDAFLCLLINPYFDELIDYVKNNANTCNKRFLKFLKKQIFRRLSDEQLMRSFQISYVEGAEFYNKHYCYQKSKEILIILG